MTARQLTWMGIAATLACACGRTGSRESDTARVTTPSDLAPAPAPAQRRADSITRCWPMRVVTPPKPLDSAIARRPAPHPDSVMVVRPACPERG